MFGGIDLMSARFMRHSFAPHSHDELMIGVMHAGVKSFRCGSSREHAAPGNLVVVNPGEMHTGEREHGRELIYAALAAGVTWIVQDTYDCDTNGLGGKTYFSVAAP
jgi:hypothetical protein